jgi:hypothetical protein
VTGGVLEPDAFAYLAMYTVVAFHDIRQPSLDHRQH